MLPPGSWHSLSPSPHLKQDFPWHCSPSSSRALQAWLCLAVPTQGHGSVALLVLQAFVLGRPSPQRRAGPRTLALLALSFPPPSTAHFTSLHILLHSIILCLPACHQGKLGREEYILTFPFSPVRNHSSTQIFKNGLQTSIFVF